MAGGRVTAPHPSISTRACGTAALGVPLHENVLLVLELGRQLGVLPRKDLLHARLARVLKAPLAVVLGAVVLVQEAVRLEAARRHQQKDAERRLAKRVVERARAL